MKHYKDCEDFGTSYLKLHLEQTAFIPQKLKIRKRAHRKEKELQLQRVRENYFQIQNSVSVLQ